MGLADRKKGSILLAPVPRSPSTGDLLCSALPQHLMPRISELALILAQGFLRLQAQLNAEAKKSSNKPHSPSARPLSQLDSPRPLSDGSQRRETSQLALFQGVTGVREHRGSDCDAAENDRQGTRGSVERDIRRGAENQFQGPVMERTRRRDPTPGFRGSSRPGAERGVHDVGN